MSLFLQILKKKKQGIRINVQLKVKVKVNCTLVEALSLCTGCTAHRGSRGIALFFLDHATRRGWGVSVTPWPHFTPGKDSVLIVQEAEWTPGLVWTGAENLASTGIRSPDRPARSQSLYRLSYPAPQRSINLFKMKKTKSTLLSSASDFIKIVAFLSQTSLFYPCSKRKA